MFHPCGSGYPVQCKRERRFTSSRRNDAKGRHKDREKIDGLQIFGTYGVNMLAEAKRHEVAVDCCGDCQRHLGHH
jgi:hypothetical protein